LFRLGDWEAEIMAVGEPTLTKFILRLVGVKVSRGDGMKRRWGKIPEGALSPYAQVLEDEPYAHLAVWVCEFEGADAETAD